MDTDLRIEIRSEPRLLSVVRAMVRAYAGEHGFNRDRCDEIVLAVDEACTNAMRHAYAHRKDETLVLTARADDAWVELELLDTGCTAPSHRVKPREAESPNPKKLKPGGLGVQLIYRVFDEAAFTPGASGGNCVRMRLKRPEREGM